MRRVPLKLVYYYADLARHRAGPFRNIPAVLVYRERTDDQIKDDLEGIFFLLLFSHPRFGEVFFQGRQWPDPKYPLRESRYVLINREREREAQQEIRNCR